MPDCNDENADDIWRAFFRNIVSDVDLIENASYDIDVYERLCRAATVISWVVRECDPVILGQNYMDLLIELLAALRDLKHDFRPSPSTIGRSSTYIIRDALKAGQPKIFISQEQVRDFVLLSNIAN